MDRRVYGTETEYALAFVTDQGRLGQQQDPGLLFDHVERALLSQYETLKADSFGRTTARTNDQIQIQEGYFIESGARFYYDAGHVEWATPEALTPQEAALYEVAGERTLLESARSIPFPRGGRLLFIKNNVDYVKGATYGCHENYQVLRLPTKREDERFFERLVQQLVPFLVTRQIYCGAGKISCRDTHSARSVGYQISQRADFIETVTSLATRQERAIVNQRNESLGNERQYRRLHLIVGDSNMSSYANILKLGATGVVLRLIEANALAATPTLRDPVEAIKLTSQDLTCQRLLPLTSGQSMNALSVQQFYLDQAERYFGQQTLDPATRQVLMMWQQTLDLLTTDPLRLADRVDWIIKRHHLLDPELAQRNLTWSNIAAWSYLIEQVQQDRRLYGKSGTQLTAEDYARYQYFVNEHHLNWNDYGIL